MLTPLYRPLLALTCRRSHALIAVDASQEEVDVKADLVDWAHAIIIGCPMHYGNPSAPLLTWIDNTWAPYWQTGALAGKLGATFSTGGSIAQGVEHVVTSLQRTLMSFNLQLVTSSPVTSAYSSYGAIAITGGPFATGSGSLAPGFVAAGKDLGQRVAKALLDRQHHRDWVRQ